MDWNLDRSADSPSVGRCKIQHRGGRRRGGGVSESEEARNGMISLKSIFKEGKRTSSQVEDQSEIGSNRKGSHRDQEMEGRNFICG
jgi:hypothetical protein